MIDVALLRRRRCCQQTYRRTIISTVNDDNCECVIACVSSSRSTWKLAYFVDGKLRVTRLVMSAPCGIDCTVALVEIGTEIATGDIYHYKTSGNRLVRGSMHSEV